MWRLTQTDVYFKLVFLSVSQVVFCGPRSTCRWQRMKDPILLRTFWSFLIQGPSICRTHFWVWLIMLVFLFSTLCLSSILLSVWLSSDTYDYAQVSLPMLYGRESYRRCCMWWYTHGSPGNEWHTLCSLNSVRSFLSVMTAWNTRKVCLSATWQNQNAYARRLLASDNN